MSKRSAVVGELGEWTEVPIKSTRQADGCSCGPFALMVTNCRYDFMLL